jgi:hypothetical protein
LQDQYRGHAVDGLLGPRTGQHPTRLTPRKSLVPPVDGEPERLLDRAQTRRPRATPASRPDIDSGRPTTMRVSSYCSASAQVRHHVAVLPVERRETLRGDAQRVADREADAPLAGVHGENAPFASPVMPERPTTRAASGITSVMSSWFHRRRTCASSMTRRHRSRADSAAFCSHRPQPRAPVGLSRARLNP